MSPSAAPTETPAAAGARRTRPVHLAARLRILERLTAGDDLAAAAAAAGQPAAAVQLVAAEAGHPDASAVYATWAALRREQGLPPATPGVPPARSHAAAGTPVLRRIPLDDLHPDPGNIRHTLPKIQEMAASLQKLGLLQPITARVQDNQLTIVIGHRRYAAAKYLGWPAIDVIINRELVPEDVLEAMLAENTHRCDLDPVEEALAVRRIIRARRLATHAQAAAHLGHSTSWVSDRLALLDLSARDQELVRSRQMTLSEATARARAATGRTRTSSAPQPPHFGAAHPLAAEARAHCRRTHLSATRLPGQVACGPCWEHVIRRAAAAGPALPSAATMAPAP